LGKNLPKKIARICGKPIVPRRASQKRAETGPIKSLRDLMSGGSAAMSDKIDRALPDNSWEWKNHHRSANKKK
jgi:hypothetical protein